jgi:hypothetical protein
VTNLTHNFFYDMYSNPLHVSSIVIILYKDAWSGWGELRLFIYQWVTWWNVTLEQEYCSIQTFLKYGCLGWTRQRWRYEILMLGLWFVSSTLMKTEFSWVAMLCQVADSCHHFKGAWYFHLQSQAAQEERHVPLKCLYVSFTMVEAS